jgi:hypothetical protein
LERAVWERKNLGPLGQETAGSSRWNKREVQGQRSFWSDDGQTGSQLLKSGVAVEKVLYQDVFQPASMPGNWIAPTGRVGGRF